MKKRARSIEWNDPPLHTFPPGDRPSGAVVVCMRCRTHIRFVTVKGPAFSADGKFFKETDQTLVQFRTPAGAWQNDRIPCQNQAVMF
jgi:hypothetical protein